MYGPKWKQPSNGENEDFNIEDWARGFLLDRKSQGLSARTLEFYEYKLSLFMKFCEDHEVKHIEKITSSLLRDFMIDMEESGHNPGGCHAFFRVIRAFMNWYAKEQDDSAWKNPIKRLKPPKLVNEPLEPVDIDVVSKMLAACKKTTFGTRDRAILLVLLDTGVRASELLNLAVSDVDVIYGTIYVRRGKGGKSRTVFIGQKTKSSLRKYLRLIDRDSEFLWRTWHGTQLTYGGLREIMRRLADRAGVQTPSLHSFRRYFALDMLRSGVDIFSLQMLMGHADIQILRRYLRQTEHDTFNAHVKGRPVDKHNL